MDWHLIVSVIVLPVALWSQLRTRTINVPALLVTPVVYGVLAVHAALSALHDGQSLLPAFALTAAGLALGIAQATQTMVFFDRQRSAYRQRGGLRPLIFWAAALVLRQAAAYWLSGGPGPAGGRPGPALTIDAVLFGLLAGRNLTLLLRNPVLWSAGLCQLRGEPAPPPADRVNAGQGAVETDPRGSAP